MTEQAKKKIRAKRDKILKEKFDRAVWFYELPLEKKKEVQRLRAELLDAPETGIFPDIPDWIMK